MAYRKQWVAVMSRFSLSRSVLHGLLSIFFLAASAEAQVALLGTDVDGLVAEARRLNPDLSVAALQAEAALARVQGAGTLPDPTFRLQLKDIDRARGSVEPTRVNRIDYTVEQEFPLWGKRGLARSV